MARLRAAAGAGQQPEAVVQTLQHLFRGQGAQPSGGQFQREWDAVQPTAQLPRRSAVVLRQPELRAHRRGPFREQRHGVLVGHRRERVGDLAVQLQGLPSGGQHPQLRGPAQQRPHQLGAGVDKMLEAVDHQEEPWSVRCSRSVVRGGRLV